MQHEKTTDSARVTLGRRNLVRGAAWAAPVVGVAAAAPAYAASRTFGEPLLGLTYAGWEWINQFITTDVRFRGLQACAGSSAIAAGDLTLRYVPWSGGN